MSARQSLRCRPTRVNLVTLGCARNEVDSSEIAGRLQVGGYELVADPAGADVVVVNTCAFVASAKKDSIDTVLAAADTGAKVVAVGCLAERYGAELAQALPEADAVLGFDAYPDLAALLGDVVDGHRPAAHTPVDRRLLLPISPAARPTAAADGVAARPRPGVRPDPAPHAAALRPGRPAEDRLRLRPALHVLRDPVVPRARSSPGQIDEIVAEAHWLAGQGVREIVLVSENSTSFGKDLPGERQLEDLLGALAAVPGIVRVRLSYLQPAETRPWLIEAIATIPGVADYYDMSFQHASEPVLRRMRRYGSRLSFLSLVEQIRAAVTGGRHPLQRDRRLPRGDRGGSRRTRGVPDRRPDGRGRRLRLLRRGRHRRRDRCPDKLDDDVIAAAGGAGHVAGRGADRAARRGPDRHRDAGAGGRERSDRIRRLGRGDPDGRFGRGPHQAPDVDGNVHDHRRPESAGRDRCGPATWCAVWSPEATASI